MKRNQSSPTNLVRTANTKFNRKPPVSQIVPTVGHTDFPLCAHLMYFTLPLPSSLKLQCRPIPRMKEWSENVVVVSY